MQSRPFALLPLALLASGCSYHFEIVATERSDRLVFEPAKKTGSGCFSDFSVRSEAGVVMWKVSAERYLPPPCDSKFPIVYGVKPRGMTEVVKPLALRTDVTYKVKGWDGDSYSGTFRFRRGIVVENIPEPH